jgi:hypothetical protein
MNDKKALHFDAGAGASEVWFCRDDAGMEFYLSPDGAAQPQSILCPAFPGRIDL